MSGSLSERRNFIPSTSKTLNFSVDGTYTYDQVDHSPSLDYRSPPPPSRKATAAQWYNQFALTTLPHSADIKSSQAVLHSSSPLDTQQQSSSNFLDYYRLNSPEELPKKKKNISGSLGVPKQK
jgi:hypothetical protein